MQAAPTWPDNFLKRLAINTPLTTEIIAPKWLIIGKQPLARTAPMHVAVPRPHRAERRTEVGAHRVQQRLAEGQTPGPVANERRKNVPFAEGKTRGGAQGLLAAAQKNAALNFASAVQLAILSSISRASSMCRNPCKN